MCTAATLSPHKTHKSTAPRNLTTKIQRISKALCSKSPNIQIFFAHLASSSLPADLNSKKVEKPLEVSSSELWRRGPDEYFELNPPSNWFLKITNNEIEWKTPVADPKMSTSSFCCCENSPDFCGKEDLILYCSTCQGSSYNCTNLHMHIESFSSAIKTHMGLNSLSETFNLFSKKILDRQIAF